MVVGEAINNIMGGIENTGTVKQHNHKKKLRQRFDIIKKLGQGTFGKVQLGINKETGQEVAIKTIKKSKIESEADLIRIRREIQIMSSVQHPNIIHIYEVFENRDKMVLVMEYAAGGELYDYLSERKVLNEEEARRIFRQIATACYYCHKHKICHRDLKLENILLDENNNAKIADFGLSNVFDDQRLLSTFCGSPLYASPEIVKGTPYQGPEVDCWSLGVLLYTLVYGAMPFDGSNFRRLVKQISQGDYFEPSTPSPASPLIREMLTVNPKNRANIEKICTHWWVNEGYSESCLEISEELANQTPVRLDVLLSLAPPPPQLESEKMMLTGEGDVSNVENIAPTRSQSVGSLMELAHPERSIMDLLKEDKATPKRKLESTVSTDRVNLDKRKEKIVKENTVADITVRGAVKDNSTEDASMSEPAPLIKSTTQILSKDMDVEQTETTVDPVLQGAACQEIIEEAERKKPSKIKKTLSAVNKVLEGINENPSQENVSENLNKENIVEKTEEPPKVDEKQPTENKVPVKKKVVKKKVLSDKNENKKEASPSATSEEKPQPKQKQEKKTAKEADAEAPAKPVERRKSRIFEAAEKFQSMLSPTESKPMLTEKEKPKKVIIPGVSVDGFKKQFERQASITSATPPKLKTAKSVDENKSVDKQQAEEQQKPTAEQKEVVTQYDFGKTEDEHKELVRNAVSIISSVLDKEIECGYMPVDHKQEPETIEDEHKARVRNAVSIITSVLHDKEGDGLTPVESKQQPEKKEDDRKERVRNAVSIISSALDKEGARKSKSRPCMMRKPPVPFGVGGRSASGNIGTISSPLSPPLGPKPFVKPDLEKLEVKQVVDQPETKEVDEPKTSSVEITLKSATLPRRKTTAQISLNYPSPQTAPMGFKTEMAHTVEAYRPEMDHVAKTKSKERIIPIAVEKGGEPTQEPVKSPPAKPPAPRAAGFQTQRSNSSQRSTISRQSTQESDSDTVASVTSTGEPIKKSPREYIIPIAVEGGGYVTPRAGSLEPSETGSTTSTMTNKSKTKFGRARRLNTWFNDRDSEDESSPFSSLRHGSVGKDSDNEDSKRDIFHMHRLRSTRPKRANLEHNDSLSSGEEDDDEQFEILTAENLFSTLLARVRDLTQRLNVDDGMRPAFPSSRLLSHFDHGTNFWNRMDSPLSRHSSFGSRSMTRPTITKTTTGSSFGVPWRRSVSRETSSDVNESFQNPSGGPKRPIGDDISNEENLNLSDLDLNKLKLSEEDALALSYLTPGLSRRIQKQLLSQLAPSEVRKLQRTLSSRAPEDKVPKEHRMSRSTDRMSSTLPRRMSSESRFAQDVTKEDDRMKETSLKMPRSFLPVRPSYDYSVRSSSIGAEPKCDNKFNYRKPKISKSLSVREPRLYSKTDLQSPESSISESLSSSYRNNDSLDSSKCTSESSSMSRPYSKYSDSSFSRYSPNRYDSSSILAMSSDNKTDYKKPSNTGTGSRRISRFLRPDFYDPPKEETNLYLKEKKEREMETQKVLKEIRDKRKGRLGSRRDRSGSREKTIETNKSDSDFFKKKEEMVKDADNLLTNVTNSIKTLEDNMKVMHDYVNVPGENKNQERVSSEKDYVNSSKALHDYVNVKSVEGPAPIVKKEKISRIARPKSYPAEAVAKEKQPETVEKDNGKLETKKESPEKESKMSKLRKGFTRQIKEKTKEDKDEENKNINAEDKGHKSKLMQSIEKKLEKFRSVKDPEEAKAIQEKKSSVENAIKRLREQSLPRNLEHCTESGLLKRAVSVEDLPGSKPLQASRKSVTKILGLFKKYEEQDSKRKPTKKVKKKDSDKSVMNETVTNGKSEASESSQSESIEKRERPRSLLFDKVRQFQYNGAKSDTVLNNGKEKGRSRLPVNNTYRRSLNLESTPESGKLKVGEAKTEKQPERKSLKLELKKEPVIVVEPAPSITSSNAEDAISKENRNSLATTDDSSTILSPSDDYLSCDSWSVCSDFHHAEPLSPLSPNGYAVYSGDESESVSDRIRRKSFYTRFNEKKRSRRPSSTYKELDYSSLDRDPNYRTPVTRRASYASSLQDTAAKSYRPYTRTTSLLNDYVNVPNRYQTYSSKIGRPGGSASLYSDQDDNALIDDLLTTAKSRKYGSQIQPTRSRSRTSVSPIDEYLIDHNLPSATTSNTQV